MLGDIIASASDLAIVVSEEGAVLSILANAAQRGLQRLVSWEGTDLRDHLTAESLPKFEAQMAAIARGDGKGVAVEINHTDPALSEFPVRYTFHRIGPDGAILMLGRDLRPVAEMQQQLIKAQMALERDYEAQREFDTRYRVLMERTQDAMVFVSLATGRITDANSAAGQLLGAPRGDLIGNAFPAEFDTRKRGEVMESLANLALDEAPGSVDLTSRRQRQALRVTPTMFRAAGERVMLCRIERAETVGETVTDELQQNLAALYRTGVDAIAFTDRDGVIRSANTAFLNLADAAHASTVKGRSLADFLVRGSVDLKVMLENTTRAGQLRMYATRLRSAVGSEVAVEVSATWLDDAAFPAIVFVLRDASRAEAMRTPGATMSDDAVRSVMELVGSATLKDIVAETTDVVEKMCIETAVELTRNNRVAAAEMLGLSRQSLYVKLRKYGLLHRGATTDED
ncbi:transcriptional regulator PpsR [Rhodobaculum claviforme]|uniref:Transcriptional regulator PpsR n=1 Tax=Rhodobaculum claviforme TaxID=1549854 RepID=A0A934TNA2_9RHOB|nr:transcriptional regulator PpsR [Rhodobaculum claviforme]MBK5928706.1 transcriptional regulator PpsR [Rhodobaculum claviforme]